MVYSPWSIDFFHINVFSVHNNPTLDREILAMNRWIAFCVVLFFPHALLAQLLTWTPPFPKESDPAQSLVITVDATKGNQGLLNYSNVSDVYVHHAAGPAYQ